MSKRTQKISPLTYLASGLVNLPIGELGTTDPNGILPALANRIAGILTALAYPLAFVGLVYSVYLLIANSGNPETSKAVKKNITYIVLGIFLMIMTIVLLKVYGTLFVSPSPPR